VAFIDLLKYRKISPHTEDFLIGLLEYISAVNNDFISLQVTPVYIQEQWPNIDWYKYLCLWERLPPDMKLVADTLGIKESFLARAVQGRVPERTPAQKEALRIHRRFFTALALHDLVHEVPIVYVARRYGASKGLLQTLQSAAGTFAGMVTVFCNRLGWKNLELLLSQFQSRLMFGVERELCELVQISLLNGFRARVLYNAGFHTLASLATANPIAVETCLRNAVPFKSNKLAQGHQKEMDDGGMGKASTWCAKLRRGMTEEEAARVIIREAQEMLARQLNVPTTVWGKNTDAPVSRGGGKNEAPPTGEHPQSNANQPSRKTPIDAESTSDHVTASANKIAALRGHRISPNTGENGGEIGKKKPCLQFQANNTSPAISCEARTTDSAKPSTTKLQQSADHSNSVAQQQTLHVHVAKPNCEGPGSLSRPDFTKASSLLLSVNKESTPAQPRAKSKRQSAADESAIILSPIPPFNIDSEIPPVTTTTTSDVNLKSENNPISNVRAEVFKKDDLGESLSPGKQFMIPDSLPTSMDGSMSFSFNTFEMIDAACGDIQLSGEKQQGQKQNGLILPNCTAAKDIEQSDNNISMKCVAESPACVDINLSAVKPSNAVNDSTDFNSFSFSPLLSPSNDRAIAPPTKTPSRLQLTEKDSAAATAVPETPSLSTSLLLLPGSQMSSLKDLSSLCSSQMSQSGVTVIEVTSNPTLFQTFLSECLEQKVVSFSVAMSKLDQGNGIGSTILKPRESRGVPLPNQNEQVEGVAFCWGGMDVYYVSLCQNSSDKNSTSAVEISLEHRTKAIRKIFTNCLAHEKLIAYDVKKHLVNLVLSCGVLLSGKTMDPVVASWMLDPDAKEKTIHRMVLQYLPDQPLVSEDEDLNEMPLSSVATHSSDPQMRASAESILAFLLMTKIEGLLEAEGLVKPFIEVEMPSLSVLSKMELNGIGFSPEECNHQKDVLQSRITELERSAYILARHTFSLTSPEDIAQVLFIELKLPCGSETSARQSKTLGPNTRRGGGGRKKIQHLSTAKDVLEKIRPLHPLPGIVLEWRRISSTLTKMVFPLFKEAVSHNDIGSVRIHPQVHIHTATGRVSLSDPNLQMVPKEFDLGSKLNLDSLSLTHSDEGNNLLSDSQFLAIEGNLEASHSSSVNPHSLLPPSVCMRNVFVPFPGGVFLAADYSQLELRILAHVSGDKKLKRFLNSDGDVFKMIAGEWLGLSADQVSERQRQETKQVCYGMVYGIGAKALGEQLGIIEEDASQFMETFKSKYPTMKKFLTKTVQECREKGYVTTLLGRKRFLQSIHSPNIHARSQAERQAVNTTIQGSAADLVKTAMVNIDKRLLARFSNSEISLGGPDSTSGGVPNCKRPTGAYLVLQLHDELLYEVAEDDMRRVARIVKHEMERALEMSVKFPVKVKVGTSWGKLEPYSVD
jgi:DNA polymerase I-like protein with 3'-5' exonuclease and polymerase domains